METKLLKKIKSPSDLKNLDYLELEQLSQEIRAFLIENVSKTGGHLSPNLGVIELTVALHKVFDSPYDTFVFDVGHQCYTHKLLTGRMDGFERLRKKNGLSGFPSPKESEHDAYTAGHASNSISAAVGIARAKTLNNEPGLVIVVIGDGAFTGGMAYEGLNNVANLRNLVIVLNDNKMSISKNVGSFSHYLTSLRTSPKYYKAKNEVVQILDGNVIGKEITKGLLSAKNVIRRTVYSSTFFEDMGLQYLGPEDGHNVAKLCNMFEHVKKIQKPVLVHVETVKGKGYTPAERNPGAFHGVPAFNAYKVEDPDMSPDNSFSTVFGKALARIANDDPKLCAVTAAMKYGTGLQYFKKQHPPRFFDVGMAEQHAVTFAGGMASRGMLPVVAIYSTFLQRTYDQIIHDIMLEKQNVIFAIDRAGLVPGDGETHQGVYDAAFLSQQTGMPIFSPSTYAELEYWLEKLIYEYEGPRAIRYPRGAEPALLAGAPCSGAEYDVTRAAKPAKTAIVTYGVETAEALGAADILLQNGMPADVFKLVCINPLPAGLADELTSYSQICFAEEGIRQGGIGEHLLMQLFRTGFCGEYTHLAVPETGIDHANVAELRQMYGLDADNIAAVLLATAADSKRTADKKGATGGKKAQSFGGKGK